MPTKKCNVCHGTGTKTETRSMTCGTCHGKGTDWYGIKCGYSLCKNGQVTYVDEKDCKQCHGKGTVDY